jgi:PPOX class probable F420-dependent enzyme
MGPTRAELLDFLRARRHAALSTVADDGAPQSAVVGVAVSDALELVFDTVASTRKAKNLRARPRVAFVLGGFEDDAQRTVQLEGVADEPAGAELERLKAVYYARFPDGPTRLAWPGLMYVRVRPTWLRYTDYRVEPALVAELDADALAKLP